MNNYVDQSLSLLQSNEGNIWINRKNKQLRFNSEQNGVSSWISPISTFSVGEDTTSDSKGLIKRGQPVSIGLISQLDQTKSGNGPSAVVVSDPSINQWAIGLAMQPGSTNETDNYYSTIHIQSSGQMEYDLSNMADDRYYLPPYSKSGNTYAFDWTYNDIGKSVYVSNKDKGELTLDIADALYDGGSVICIGHIADAPLSKSDSQKILIEIQISGDDRGIIDSTQLSVTMRAPTGNESSAYLSSDYDKLMFVKLSNKNNKNIGDFILSTDDLNSSNQPIGAVLITTDNGKINYGSLYGKDITVTRLGVITGNFGISTSDIGKILYLNPPNIGTYSESDTIEYKIGVALSENRILVDCRYIKDYTKFSMIGTIKPAYSTLDSSGNIQFIADPGFAVIDPDVIHTVYNDSTNIAWEELIKACYAKDIFVFSKNGTTFSRLNEKTINNKVWTLNGDGGTNKILDPTNNTYFKFRDIYYTIKSNGTNYVQACQIKYSKEGSDESSQSYVWPEQAYNIELDIKSSGGVDGGNYENPSIKINITSLVSAGQAIDGNNLDIESYFITLKYLDEDTNTSTYISPGFSQVTIDDETYWSGYEWQIKTVESTGGIQTFLYMITVPKGASENSCLGPMIGINPLDKKSDFIVNVRRRPTQYNSFYLNQFPSLNPWTPKLDDTGNLVLAGNKIYLSANLTANKDTSTTALSGYDTKVAYNAYLDTEINDNDKTMVFTTYGETNNGNTTKSIQQIFTLNDNSVIWTYDFSDSSTPVISVNGILPSSTIISTLGYDENTSDDSYVDMDDVNATSIIRNLQIRNYEDSSSNKVIYMSTYNISGYYYNINDSNGIIESSSSSSLNISSLDDASSKGLSILYNLTNGNTINYLSNIGLLNKAVSEIDNRLYMLERGLYGINTPFAIASDSFDDSTYISRYFGDLGLLRLYKFLDDFGIFSKNSLSLSSFRDLSAYKNVYSYLTQFYIDNYGDYTNSSEYTTEASNFYTYINDDTHSNSSGGNIIMDWIYSKGVDSHLSDLWIFYKNLQTTIGMLKFQSIAANSTSLSDTNISDKDILTISSDIINPGFLIHPTTFANMAMPLSWPLSSDTTIAKSINFENNFFNSNIVGLDDGTDTSYNSTYNTRLSTDHTFSAQSLTGWLYDIFSKLTFLRSKFNLDHTIVSTGILTQPYIFASYDEGYHSLAFSNVDTVSFNDYTAAKNTYTAFQFKNNKIIRGLSTYLAKKNTLLVYSNKESTRQTTTPNENTTVVLNSFTYDGTTYNLTDQLALFKLRFWSSLASYEAQIYTSMLRYPDEDNGSSSSDEDEEEETIDLEQERKNIISYIGYWNDTVVAKVNQGIIYNGHYSFSSALYATVFSTKVYPKVITKTLSNITYEFTDNKFKITSTPSLCFLDDTTNTYSPLFMDGYDSCTNDNNVDEDEDDGTSSAIATTIAKLSTGEAIWSYYMKYSIWISSPSSDANKSTIQTMINSVIAGNSPSSDSTTTTISALYDKSNNTFAVLPTYDEDDGTKTYAAWSEKTVPVYRNSLLETSVVENYSINIKFPDNNDSLATGKTWNQKGITDSSNNWNNHVVKTTSYNTLTFDDSYDKSQIISQIYSNNGIRLSHHPELLGFRKIKRYDAMSDIILNLVEKGIPSTAEYRAETIISDFSYDGFNCTLNEFDFVTSTSGDVTTSDSEENYTDLILDSHESITSLDIIIYSTIENWDKVFDLLKDDTELEYTIIVDSQPFLKKNTDAVYDTTITVSDKTYKTIKITLTNISGLNSVPLSIIVSLNKISSVVQTYLKLTYKSVNKIRTYAYLHKSDSANTEVSAYDKVTGENQSFTLPTWKSETDEYKLTSYTQDTTEDEINDESDSISSDKSNINVNYSVDDDNDPEFSELKGYPSDDSQQTDTSNITDIDKDVAFKDSLIYGKAKAQINQVIDKDLKDTLINFFKTEIFARISNRDDYIRDLVNYLYFAQARSTILENISDDLINNVYTISKNLKSNSSNIADAFDDIYSQFNSRNTNYSQAINDNIDNISDIITQCNNIINDNSSLSTSVDSIISAFNKIGISTTKDESTLVTKLNSIINEQKNTIETLNNTIESFNNIANVLSKSSIYQDVYFAYYIQFTSSTFTIYKATYNNSSQSYTYEEFATYNYSQEDTTAADNNDEIVSTQITAINSSDTKTFTLSTNNYEFTINDNTYKRVNKIPTPSTEKNPVTYIDTFTNTLNNTIWTIDNTTEYKISLSFTDIDKYDSTINEIDASNETLISVNASFNNKDTLSATSSATASSLNESTTTKVNLDHIESSYEDEDEDLSWNKSLFSIDETDNSLNKLYKDTTKPITANLGSSIALCCNNEIASATGSVTSYGISFTFSINKTNSTATLQSFSVASSSKYYDDLKSFNNKTGSGTWSTSNYTNNSKSDICINFSSIISNFYINFSCDNGTVINESVSFDISKFYGIRPLSSDTVSISAVMSSDSKSNTFSWNFPNYYSVYRYDDNDSIIDFNNKIKKISAIYYDKAFQKRNLVKDYYISGTLNSYTEPVYLSLYKGSDKQNDITAIRLENKDYESFYDTKTLSCFIENWKFDSSTHISGYQIPEPTLYYKLKFDDIDYLTKLDYKNEPDSYTSSITNSKTNETPTKCYMNGILLRRSISFIFNNFTYKVKGLSVFYYDSKCTISEKVEIEHQLDSYGTSENLGILLRSKIAQNFKFIVELQDYTSDDYFTNADSTTEFLVGSGDLEIAVNSSTSYTKITSIDKTNGSTINLSLDDESIKYMLYNSNLVVAEKRFISKVSQFATVDSTVSSSDIKSGISALDNSFNVEILNDE